jgi:hypothetical protein
MDDGSNEIEEVEIKSSVPNSVRTVLFLDEGVLGYRSSSRDVFRDVFLPLFCRLDD